MCRAFLPGAFGGVRIGTQEAVGFAGAQLHSLIAMVKVIAVTQIAADLCADGLAAFVGQVAGKAGSSSFQLTQTADHLVFAVDDGMKFKSFCASNRTVQGRREMGTILARAFSIVGLSFVYLLVCYIINPGL